MRIRARRREAKFDRYYLNQDHWHSPGPTFENVEPPDLMSEDFVHPLNALPLPQRVQDQTGRLRVDGDNNGARTDIQERLALACRDR